ncbi:hypothetical protein VARIO8X_110106 [Burkholderiales bacterium 8X]|nr:hypothetical protein VARIO8X_110106 [Burkholderiales bacterium 8X]
MFMDARFTSVHGKAEFGQKLTIAP